MTVIACKNGVMAADTSWWHGDIHSGKAQKIWRIKDTLPGIAGTHHQFLFAAAGHSTIVEMAREWLRAGATADSRPAAALEDHLDAIILRVDGTIWCLDHKFTLCQGNRNYDVAGSHHEFLHGALLAGLSAEDAVRLAIRHCAKAGGDVQVERL